MKKVILYSSTACPVCEMVRQFMQTVHIPYEEITVDFRPIERSKLILSTGKLTVPQTNIAGAWISGFQPEEILSAWNMETE